MTTINVTVRGRRLELDVPSDWPDGIEVQIQPLESTMPTHDELMSAAEIAQPLAAMDQVQPLELSEAENLAWEIERQHRKERYKARFAEHADKLRRSWE